MHSELAWRRRSSIKQARELLRTEGGRFIDYGVALIPVTKDEAKGTVVLDGKPGVFRAGETQRFGGIWDTLHRRWRTDLESDPLVWYCSPQQLEVIVHDRAKTQNPYLLAFGAEGVGKTQILVMHGLIRTIALAGSTRHVLYGGVTAPAGHRVDTIVRILQEKTIIDSPNDRRDDSWGTYFKHEREIRFHFNVTWQLRSTEIHSKAAGSPIQGYSWAFH